MAVEMTERQMDFVVSALAATVANEVVNKYVPVILSKLGLRPHELKSDAEVNDLAERVVNTVHKIVSDVWGWGAVADVRKVTNQLRGEKLNEFRDLLSDTRNTTTSVMIGAYARKMLADYLDEINRTVLPALVADALRERYGNNAKLTEINTIAITYPANQQQTVNLTDVGTVRLRGVEITDVKLTVTKDLPVDLGELLLGNQRITDATLQQLAQVLCNLTIHYRTYEVAGGGKEGAPLSYIIDSYTTEVVPNTQNLRDVVVKAVSDICDNAIPRLWKLTVGTKENNPTHLTAIEERAINQWLAEIGRQHGAMLGFLANPANREIRMWEQPTEKPVGAVRTHGYSIVLKKGALPTLTEDTTVLQLMFTYNMESNKLSVAVTIGDNLQRYTYEAALPADLTQVGNTIQSVLQQVTSAVERFVSELYWALMRYTQDDIETIVNTYIKGKKFELTAIDDPSEYIATKFVIDEFNVQGASGGARQPTQGFYNITLTITPEEPAHGATTPEIAQLHAAGLLPEKIEFNVAVTSILNISQFSAVYQYNIQSYTVVLSNGATITENVNLANLNYQYDFNDPETIPAGLQTEDARRLVPLYCMLVGVFDALADEIFYSEFLVENWLRLLRKHQMLPPEGVTPAGEAEGEESTVEQPLRFYKRLYSLLHRRRS